MSSAEVAGPLLICFSSLSRFRSVLIFPSTAEVTYVFVTVRYLLAVCVAKIENTSYTNLFSGVIEGLTVFVYVPFLFGSNLNVYQKLEYCFAISASPTYID